MAKGKLKIRLVCNPETHILGSAISYFNSNLSNGEFPFLVRTDPIPLREAEFWFERQTKGLEYRVVALSPKEEVVGLGYVARGLGRHHDTAKIGFTVAPEHRRQGVGGEICRSLISGARAISMHRLETDPFMVNTPAIALLSRFGFRSEGISRDRAKDGGEGYLDTLQMALLLGDVDATSDQPVHECPFCPPLVDKQIVYQSHFCNVIIPERVISMPQCLVVPQKHYITFETVPPETASEMLEMCHRLARIFSMHFDTDGTNIFVQSGRSSGQTVAHVHAHVLSRFNGDVPEPGNWLSHEFESLEFTPGKEQLVSVTGKLNRLLSSETLESDSKLI